MPSVGRCRGRSSLPGGVPRHVGGEARAEVAHARIREIEWLGPPRAELEPIHIQRCETQCVADNWWVACIFEWQVFMGRFFYCCICDKTGTVFSQATKVPFKGCLVQPNWILNLVQTKN